MAVRPIRIWPDPVLSEKAARVENIDDEVRALVSDMFATMYEANGIGLAAPQVGVGQRILVLDLSPYGDSDEGQEVLAEWSYPGRPLVFINPELERGEGTIVWDEGCLSLPGVTVPVKRKATVQVRALDLDGNEQLTEAHGLFAVALQHEMDHLDGITFADYLSRLKRDVVRKKMLRIKEEHHDNGVEAAQALAENAL